MRHYEIVLLIHPDQSEQVPAMLERYKALVTAGGGKVHRVEDWGRRQLAYMIQKLAKAHYLCLNIECEQGAGRAGTGFRFNDAVLRHLTVAKDKAETTPSVMMKSVEKEEARKAAQEATPEAPRGALNRLMNRLVLAPNCRARRLRYTPPDCRPWTSAEAPGPTVSEDGQPRQVAMQLKGGGNRGGHAACRSPGAWSTGHFRRLPGRLAQRQGLVFHVTEIDA
jgi:small subunit ribosomal protein S6